MHREAYRLGGDRNQIIIDCLGVSKAQQALSIFRPQPCTIRPLSNVPTKMEPLIYTCILQVGKGKCHIVDTFWQTETGGHVMLPLANVTPTKPGSCSFPFFGIEVHTAGSPEVAATDTGAAMVL